MQTPELENAPHPAASLHISQHAFEAKQALAQLLNVPQAEHILFTSSPHPLAQAIHSFPWRPGEGIVISASEHRSILRAVRAMARERGIQFYIVPYNDAIPFDLNVFESLLQRYPHIRMVITHHASNVIGSLQPIETIGKLAHEYQKQFWVDISQTIGHLPLSLPDIQPDLIVWHGNLAVYMPPYISGVYCLTAHTAKLLPQEPTLASTMNLITESIGQLQEMGPASIRERESALLTHLLDELLAIPEVVVYGHTEVAQKIPLVSLNVLNQHPHTLAEQLPNTSNLRLEAGFHDAPMAHEAISTTHRGGTLRVELNYQTTPEEIDAFLQTLKTLIYSMPQRNS